MSSHPIKLRWRLLEIVLLLVIVSIGATFVRHVGARLDGRMEQLKSQVIQLLEDRIDREISYGSISPSVFGYLGIRDLVIHSSENPDEVLLRISRVKIYYNLFRFLTTRNAVQALSEIQIANSYFEVDLVRDRELIRLLNSLRTGQRDLRSPLLSRIGDPPSTGPGYPQIDLSGTNITIRYTSGDWQVEVSDLFFTIATEQQLYEIGVRGRIEARHKREGIPIPGWMSTRVKISGTLDRFFTWSNIALQIYSLSTETVDVKRQTLQVVYESENLEVRKIQDRAPLDVQVSYDTNKRDLSVQFTTEGFRPSDLVRLTGALDRFNPYLNSSVSSRGTFAVNIDTQSIAYSAQLQIDPPRDLLPFEMSLSGRMSGNERILYLSPLRLDSARGNVQFNGSVLIGTLLPAGLLHFDEFSSVGGQKLNASLKIERGVETVSIESSALKLGQTSFELFDLNLTPQGRSVRFAVEAALENDPGFGEISADGRFDWETKPVLSTEASVRRLPLDTLYRVTAPNLRISPRLQRELGRYAVSVTGEATTDFSTFQLSTDRLEILDTRRPENFLSLKAVMDSDSLDLNDIQLRWEEYSLRGDVAVERSEETIAMSTLIWFEDTPYQIDLDLQPNKTLQFSGSYGLKGYYHFNPTNSAMLLDRRITQLRGQSFGIRSENLPIVLKNGTVYASVDVAGLLGPDRAIYTSSSTARLRDIPFSTVKKNTLDLLFSLNDNRMSIDRIAYSDAHSTLNGSGIAEIGELLPLQASGSIVLESPGNAESYRGNAAIADKQVRGQLEFSSSPIKRFGIEAVNGTISGSISMNGTLPRPDLSLSLSLNEGRLNLDPLDLDLRATYTPDSFEISSLDAAFLNHQITGGRGRILTETGEFFFASAYRAEYFEQIVNLGVDLRGTIGGLPWPLTLEGLLEKNLEGRLAFIEISVDEREVPDWNVDLAGEAGVLSFQGGPGDSISGRVSRDGSFALNLREPLPIQGRADGTIMGNQLDSNFFASAVDMRIINTMTPRTDVFTFTTGIARGRLRIFGPINDPDWVGYLDVSEAELLFAPSPDVVKPLNGRLIFEGKSFTLPRTSSYSGKSKIQAEGFFYIDHWVPEGVELIFYAEEYPGVHIAYPFNPIYVDGYATGAVRVRSDPTTVKLDGKIQANSCRIALRREESEEQVGRSGGSAPMSVDMDITTGRSVEFFWPAMNFPIVRTFARQGEQVLLYVNEDTGEFFMEGEVDIRGGEIFYFDRSFYLKQGSIAFEERIDEFDPWIYALAEIRERDLNNEEIKIYLEANNKISLFSPRFYSEPSRPDVEILNLIGGTILNRFEQTDFGTAAVMLTSDIVGQFGILTPFERAVREVLNLDLFTIRTQFLQNVLIGKIRGENLVENTFNPLDNTTLTLGKYLGTDLFLEALIRFQNVDDFTTSSNIRTEGELNLEWVTPFFLLEWTFTPTHPENLFLSDNSIGLSWKYSY